MKLNKNKMDLIRTRQCMTLEQLRIKAKCSHNSIKKGYQEDVDPNVIGRIAKALGVDVAEIIVQEE